jgi:hypothetical protein
LEFEQVRLVMEKDYYQILGVSTAATVEELRSSYKSLALRLHPDRSRDPRATEQMQLVNEAYAVLRDQEKRAQYDLMRLAPAAAIVPVHPGEATQPIRRVRRRPRMSSEKMYALMWKRLTFLLRLMLVLAVLFLWSLLTGTVNVPLLFGLVLTTVLVVAVMVWQVRRYVVE